jgi:membrane fusion protein (multidrug efflux system)
MKKRLMFTMIGLVILIAVIVAVKALQIGAMIDQGKNFVPPPQTVTSTVADRFVGDCLNAVGTLVAVQAVAAELW